MIYMNDIEYDPTNVNIMFAVSLGAVYKSTDGGTTWNPIPNLNLANDGAFTDIGINPTAPNNIIVSGFNEFHRSNDGGQTWFSNDFYTANTSSSKIHKLMGFVQKCLLFGKNFSY